MMETAKDFIGKKVYSRSGGGTGRVVGVRHEHCAACGKRMDKLCVVWPDGKRTHPCVKGCAPFGKNALRVE